MEISSTNGKEGVCVCDVLLLTVLIIPKLAVYQEDGKVNDIEIGDRCVEAGGQGPGERHKEVTAACELVSGQSCRV